MASLSRRAGGGCYLGPKMRGRNVDRQVQGDRPADPRAPVTAAKTRGAQLLLDLAVTPHLYNIEIAVVALVIAELALAFLERTAGSAAACAVL